MLDAIVFYGDVPDVVVAADTTELESKYGAEFVRRRRLTDEALKLQLCAARGTGLHGVSEIQRRKRDRADQAGA